MVAADQAADIEASDAGDGSYDGHAVGASSAVNIDAQNAIRAARIDMDKVSDVVGP
jgi:hypothetical protein